MEAKHTIIFFVCNNKNPRSFLAENQIQNVGPPIGCQMEIIANVQGRQAASAGGGKWKGMKEEVGVAVVLFCAILFSVLYESVEMYT